MSLAARRWPYFAGDLWLAHHIQDLPLSATGTLVTFMNADFPALTIAAGAGTGLLLIYKGRRAVGFLLAGSLLIRASSPVLKALSDRPRPDAALIKVAEHHSDPSFPSGHSLGAFAFFAVLFVLVGDLPASGPARLALRAVIVAVVLLVGLCRVVAGAHWPSDVLGGYLWAAVLVLPLIAWYRRLTQRQRRR